MNERHSMEQKIADVAAIQAGHCPECGDDISKVDANAHAESHWPDFGPTHPMDPDAARRKKLVINYHRDVASEKESK